VDRLIIVSGDGHAAAPLESYRPYLESKYHAALSDDHHVDERLVEHFDKRGGFRRPADPVDTDAIGNAFRSDLAGVAPSAR
jgi:hypothetical protein